MLPSDLPSFPTSLTEYKICRLTLSANAVGEAISAASDTGVQLPVFASKKQEEIPFPAAFARVPRKIRNRDEAAPAFDTRAAAVKAVAPIRKSRLFKVGLLITAETCNTMELSSHQELYSIACSLCN